MGNKRARKCCNSHKGFRVGSLERGLCAGKWDAVACGTEGVIWVAGDKPGRHGKKVYLEGRDSVAARWAALRCERIRAVLGALPSLVNGGAVGGNEKKQQRVCRSC